MMVLSHRKLHPANLVVSQANVAQRGALVYIPEGENWSPWFRFYGPEKAVEVKSWKMPDIEIVN